MIYRLVLSLLLGLLFTGCLGRPFPKRLTGSYTATQDKYSVTVKEKPITVPEMKFRVELQYDQLLLQSEQQKNVTSYTVGEKIDGYYPLSINFEDGSIENWELYPKGKKLIRTKQAPRPSVIFLKN